MTQPAFSPPALRLAWTVGFVSAAVLGFEIALMRLLLVASWHHFAFLVISVVLLGFGASGTALVVLRGWALRRSEPLLFGLALLTAASMPLCWAMAQHVPLEAHFAPALFWQQLASWCLYWAVLTVPFLFGAAVIGLALMVAGQRIAIVYGSNLIGSAAGSVGAVLAMALVPPEWLPWAMGVPALIGAARVWPARRGAGMAAMAATVIAVATGLLLEPPRVRTDPYKYGAYVQRLAAQGSAERLARVYGPRAQIEAYHGQALHDFPFLGPGIAPPLLSVIVIDGHWGGSVPDIASAEEARVVDQTLMAFPYLVAGQPRRVALLGERGGTNIWLAAPERRTLVRTSSGGRD